jgi:hypothetical protein
VSSIPPAQFTTEPEATLARLPICDRALVRGDEMVLDEVGPLFVTKGVPDEKGVSRAARAWVRDGWMARLDC